MHTGNGRDGLLEATACSGIIVTIVWTKLARLFGLRGCSRASCKKSTVEIVR
jgi:hypothetical protein